MEKERLDLERKLRVGIGDLICLWNDDKGWEVSGYVEKLEERYVTLSHERPGKRQGMLESGARWLFGITRGNRIYDLKQFQFYQILQESTLPHNGKASGF